MEDKLLLSICYLCLPVMEMKAETELLRLPEFVSRAPWQSVVEYNSRSSVYFRFPTGGDVQSGVGRKATTPSDCGWLLHCSGASSTRQSVRA